MADGLQLWSLLGEAVRITRCTSDVPFPPAVAPQHFGKGQTSADLELAPVRGMHVSHASSFCDTVHGTLQ